MRWILVFGVVVLIAFLLGLIGMAAAAAALFYVLFYTVLALIAMAVLESLLRGARLGAGRR